MSAAINATNDFARSARAKKIEKLVAAIDEHARFRGFDPQRDAIRIAKVLRGQQPEWWAMISGKAGIRVPSDLSPRGLTIRGVIGEYLRRATELGKAAS